ncbi:Uncharacterised protein [Bordetella pertussis]|nr:Uncharacterised protein [Bordetella pertussis]CFU94044.1 Uncharacterised protein [Bordetella pertussis]CPM37779.1 Uncharacterised protein [Bordetella pertussis]CPO26766.1 Uncharacterised protein [Bordetella pertussis]CPO41151.1 Uncharacterised protein [Bordetella pertussis]
MRLGADIDARMVDLEADFLLDDGIDEQRPIARRGVEILQAQALPDMRGKVDIAETDVLRLVRVHQLQAIQLRPRRLA